MNQISNFFFAHVKGLVPLTHLLSTEFWSYQETHMSCTGTIIFLNAHVHSLPLSLKTSLISLPVYPISLFFFQFHFLLSVHTFILLEPILLSSFHMLFQYSILTKTINPQIFQLQPLTIKACIVFNLVLNFETESSLTPSY